MGANETGDQYNVIAAGIYIEFNISDPVMPSVNETELDTAGYNKGFVLNLIYTTITSFMALAGITGNVLVIGAVLIYPALQSLANVFVVNLAIADLCVCVVLNSFLIAGMFTNGDLFQNEFVCHFFSSVCLISCTCSIWSVAAIGVNRYVSICHFVRYRKYFNKRSIPVMITAIWMVGVVVDLPNFVGWNRHIYDDRFLHCAWDPSASASYKYYTFVVVFILPTIILMFCYSRIILFFRASKLELQRVSNDERHKIRTFDKRLLRSVAVVMAMFSFLWLPYGVFAFSDYKFHWSRSYYMFGVTCAHLSSCINSLVYATTNATFREGYKVVVRRCFRPCLLGNQRSSVRRGHPLYRLDNSVSGGLNSKLSIIPE